MYAQVRPLCNAHAHNDYKHAHPLSDAMHYGFTSFEADIFLQRGRFIVAHVSPFLEGSKTLEALYLKPMADSVAKHGGTLYDHYSRPVLLLIDIKTDAEETYAALCPLLEKYSAMLTVYENDSVRNGAVTVIITGHKPYRSLSGESRRLAFIDEPLTGIEAAGRKASACPLASTKYSNVIKWKGKGTVPPDQKAKLEALVSTAHRQGKKVRLWASPENKAVWQFLLDCGVDLINTDDLEGLQKFLSAANG